MERTRAATTACRVSCACDPTADLLLEIAGAMLDTARAINPAPLLNAIHSTRAVANIPVTAINSRRGMVKLQRDMGMLPVYNGPVQFVPVWDLFFRRRDLCATVCIFCDAPAKVDKQCLFITSHKFLVTVAERRWNWGGKWTDLKGISCRSGCEMAD